MTEVPKDTIVHTTLTTTAKDHPVMEHQDEDNGNLVTTAGVVSTPVIFKVKRKEKVNHNGTNTVLTLQNSLMELSKTINQHDDILERLFATLRTRIRKSCVFLFMMTSIESLTKTSSHANSKFIQPM